MLAYIVLFKTEKGLFQKQSANLTFYFIDENRVTFPFLNSSLIKLEEII